MNIDDIEKQLNSHESNTGRILAILLNETVKNQALLQTIMDSQLEIIGLVAPEVDTDDLAKQWLEKTNVHLAQIQARISAKF